MPLRSKQISATPNNTIVEDSGTTVRPPPTIEPLAGVGVRFESPIYYSAFLGLWLAIALGGPRHRDRMFTIITFEPAVIAHAHSVAVAQVHL